MTEATPTSATLADFVEIYGRPTITFGTATHQSHHWYRSPYIVLNEFNNGTRTACETVPPNEPLHDDRNYA
jgi:hypothetical protein